MRRLRVIVPAGLAALIAAGCQGSHPHTMAPAGAPSLHASHFPDLSGLSGPHGADAGIRVPTDPPEPVARPTAVAVLPSPPKDGRDADPKELNAPRGTDLALEEVLLSVNQSFPLLVAAELIRDVAAGQRLAAEGAFDLGLRGRAGAQGGSFPSERLDIGLEQPTIWGPNVFAGYRLGRGDFPVYYGDRSTGEAGEFRAGVTVPLLRDAAIDRRRALLRQGQIDEALADPVIQRARIDYVRSAARAYWTWVASGAQVRVSDSLLRIARDRQEGLERQLKAGLVSEFNVVDNRRLIAEREGALIAAERRWQQASFDLSLFLRDSAGNPVVPGPDRLPRDFATRTLSPPDPKRLAADLETAIATRPELTRFRFLKERATVDLRLAENQQYPSLNAGVAGAVDAGKGKKGDGIFAPDRTNVEGFVTLEVPLQRREARGREQVARANLGQLTAQERFARDQIEAEVKDAVSNLDRTYQRLLKAKEEQGIAQRVADLEYIRFAKQQVNLLEVNLREIAAASAQAKVVDALADYYRALAEYRAALGLDATAPRPLPAPRPKE